MISDAKKQKLEEPMDTTTAYTNDTSMHDTTADTLIDPSFISSTKSCAFTDSIHLMNVEREQRLEQLEEQDILQLKNTEHQVTDSLQNCEFRLRLSNLKKYSLAKDYKSLLESKGINEKLKKNPDWNHGFITFCTKDEQQDALGKLENLVYKNTSVQVEALEPSSARVIKDRPANTLEDDTRPQSERLKDQVTPLWRLSYVLLYLHVQSLIIRSSILIYST